MWFLHSPCCRSTFPRGLCRQLFSRSFPSGRLASGLLGSCHVKSRKVAWCYLSNDNGHSDTPPFIYRRARIPGSDRWANGLIWLVSAASLLFHGTIIPYTGVAGKVFVCLMITTWILSKCVAFMTVLVGFFAFLCFFFHGVHVSRHLVFYVRIASPIMITCELYLSGSDVLTVFT